MKVKEVRQKVGLKLSIQIMVSAPITAWQIDGETMETVTDFILGGSKIAADGDCSHEIQRCLLLVKKSYDKPGQHTKIFNYFCQHYFTDKGPYRQCFDFSNSHVWM